MLGLGLGWFLLHSLIFTLFFKFSFIAYVIYSEHISLRLKNKLKIWEKYGPLIKIRQQTSSSLSAKQIKLAKENFLSFKILSHILFINLLASDRGFFNKAYTAEQGRKGEQQETGTPTKTQKSHAQLRQLSTSPSNLSQPVLLTWLHIRGHFLLIKSFTVPKMELIYWYFLVCY